MEESEPPKFPAFPYEPYSIQIDFMKALYRSLNKGGVSMLESPTGTGKTLSIICSALQWLVDRKQQLKSEANQTQTPGGGTGSDDEPDWMKNFGRNQGSCRNLLSPNLVEEGIHEKKDRKSKRKAGGVSINSSSDEEEEDDNEEDGEGLKIYFCSRTHSQLSQFVKELRKTIFGNEMKVVCLGSRKISCINEEVLKLGNSTRINERCLELQQNKKKEVSKLKNLGSEGRIRRTKASSGCPMLRNHKLQKQFRSEISQEGALDIEDLVHLGRRMGTCPYYGSRSIIPAADLVVLPYQSLLSKSSRESLGLNLKNNIVIIDEAHNLADSLISMYDAKITSSQLEHVHSHIKQYLQRFRNFLGPGNRRYIQTLLVVTRAFLQILLNGKDTSLVDPGHDAEKAFGAKSASDSSMAINDFLFSLNIDNINLVKLLHYIKESNIIHKVSGYGDKVAYLRKGSALNDGGESNEEGSTLSGFRAFVDMLQSLTNNDGDGKIIISRAKQACSGQQGGYLKYVMLTGEKIFSEIVDQAHAVILAGGTLQPIEETRERLFPWLTSDQFHFFSCSHIIPPESILPVALSHGPSGQSFDFSYSSRSSSIMIEELGLLLCNLVTVVPEGIVVFFSSFDYEGQVHDAWKASGILERIMKKKCVFREPRKNTDVEFVLKEYKEAIDKSSDRNQKEDPVPQNGAILLAVVGGKISEGINFSDGMGRCIVMVGLPYPSPSDIELLERVKYIEGLGHRGKEYYENLCMKAVNQSIGRAIRHINDYAAILLVDARYASDPLKRSFSHPTNKLPQWIKDCLVPVTGKYGEAHRLLHQFFKFNKKRGCQ
ncbi:unnamed protein product, partial [Vitis vinifera]